MVLVSLEKSEELESVFTYLCTHVLKKAFLIGVTRQGCSMATQSLVKFQYPNILKNVSSQTEHRACTMQLGKCSSVFVTL